MLWLRNLQLKNKQWGDNMRKYALVIFNNEDKIIDRFNLDFVQNPTGNGFQLTLTKLSGDIQDIVTSVKHSKSQIKFTIYQDDYGYKKANILTSWIQKYSPTNFTMALEYYDGNVVKYCEGRVTALTKTELDELGSLPQELTFQQTTPYFQKKENTVLIQKSNTGKAYPYCYPYSYGNNVVENNLVDNPYILEIPLIVKIKGPITNPTISLIDENGDIYTRVKFDNITINNNDILVINSAQMKIYKETNGIQTDFKPEVSPQYDSFLWAKTGKSYLNINTSDTADGFKLTGGWRQYSL